MKDHPLFEAYPLNGAREISVGSVPTPYHVYDGQGVLLGGTADFLAVSALLQNDAVHPFRTTAGDALMGVWAVDFREASLGPHHELQLSFLVAHEPQPPLPAHPLAMLSALFANPAARMFCYGLWNNTKTAVSYNRELLGLDAKLTNSQIEQTSGQKSFHFVDENGRLLIKGHVSEQKRTPPKVGWSLLRTMGWRQTVEALRTPYLEAKVVNPKGVSLTVNADAQSFLAADQPVVQFYDSAKDAVRFGAQTEGALKFQPQFVEHFEPFRFVYLMPQVAIEAI